MILYGVMEYSLAGFSPFFFVCDLSLIFLSSIFFCFPFFKIISKWYNNLYIVSKVMDVVIRGLLYSHFVGNELFSPSQFDFMK